MNLKDPCKSGACGDFFLPAVLLWIPASSQAGSAHSTCVSLPRELLHSLFWTTKAAQSPIWSLATIVFHCLAFILSSPETWAHRMLCVAFCSPAVQNMLQLASPTPPVMKITLLTCLRNNQSETEYAGQLPACEAGWPTLGILTTSSSPFLSSPSLPLLFPLYYLYLIPSTFPPCSVPSVSFLPFLSILLSSFDALRCSQTSWSESFPASRRPHRGQRGSIFPSVNVQYHLSSIYFMPNASLGLGSTLLDHVYPGPRCWCPMEETGNLRLRRMMCSEWQHIPLALAFPSSSQSCKLIWKCECHSLLLSVSPDSSFIISNHLKIVMLALPERSFSVSSITVYSCIWPSLLLMSVCQHP